MFSDVLDESAGKRVSKTLRVRHGTGENKYVLSFLCFRADQTVGFLADGFLTDTRHGFVFLVERRGYLAVFHHLAKGLERSVTALSQPVDRRRLTHIWSDQARYQRFSTRRMSVSNQELRGASYDAEDLETALVPAIAARSIVQSLGLETRDHGAVGVTPNTGRVRVKATRAGLQKLLAFVDSTLDGVENTDESPFLSAFPSHVDLEDLPEGIEPAGLLINGALLGDLAAASDMSIEAKLPGQSPEDLIRTLATVFELHWDGSEWEARDGKGQAVARVRRLKHSFGLYSDLAKGFVVRDAGGEETPLDRWLREQRAFSLSFTSPEFFYAGDALLRTGGFSAEASTVRTFLTPKTSLEDAQSEKGGSYAEDAVRFEEGCIFRIVEDDLAVGDDQLWCGDLGDEWADYIGAGEDSITFFHCKHGKTSAGATDLQIVTAQALKNLSRVKFRRDEVEKKIELAKDRNYWGNTHIPLLARGAAGWSGLEDRLREGASSPRTRWRVAVVVTAVSVAVFEAEAARAQPKPYFIQLVWLLSAFISSCRERDAQPIIYCRP